MDNLLEITSLKQVFGTRNPTYALDGVSFNIPATAKYCEPGGRKR